MLAHWPSAAPRIFVSFVCSLALACGPQDPKSYDGAPETRARIPEPVPGVPLTPPSLTSDAIPTLGEGTSFELAAWNIENFPKSPSNSLTMTSAILQKMDVDVIGVQEIADTASFQELVKALRGYRSVLSPHEYNPGDYQKLGLLYREEQFDHVSERLLYTDDAYAFPRPPLEVRLRFRQGPKAQREMVIIVVHLKAQGDEPSRLRREKANFLLADHVQALQASEPDLPVMLVGDFNERTNFEAGRRVFEPWLSRPDLYRFYTEPLAAAGDYSFISPSKPLIDHVIGTNDLVFDEVKIPKLELILSNYRDQVSDHLPVVVRAQF